MKKADPQVGFFHPRNWIILQLVVVQNQEQHGPQDMPQKRVQPEKLVLKAHPQQQEQLVQQEQLLQQLVLVLLLFSSKRSKR
jgi:hypothetical protein